MTNTELTNYLSNKQCCLEQLTVETLNKLKIGSSDSRCLQKEIIFANILFEILSCSKPGNVAARGILSGIAGSSGTAQLLVNGVAISGVVTKVLGDTDFTFLYNLMTSVNSTTSTPDYTMSFDTSLGTFIISALEAAGDSPNGFDITATVTGGLSITSGLEMFGGVDAGDYCLDEDDVCLLAPYLNKICESC